MLPEDLRATLDQLGVPVPTCRRVLVVDDEPSNLEVLSALLEDDWDVRTAASGDQALKLLAAEGPVDLIIADQRMPGITGVELLSQVAREYPATMRIVLTGYTDVEPMLAAANLGLVYRFMFKPYDPYEIRAVVTDALQLRAWASALLALATALDRRRRELQTGTRELKEAREQLVTEERLTTLGRLVTGMAMDLRSQSGSLSLLLGLVRQTIDDPQVLQAGQRAWDGLGQLRDLLQQVSAYTSATTSRPVFAAVTPAALFAGAVELFLMEELGHRCAVQASQEAASEPIMVDAKQLQQALLAMLRNAARASEQGAAIQLAARRGVEGAVSLEVSDQGRGMDSPTLARARDPFFSGYDSPGIGLGLEIARLAAEAHGGELQLESQEGLGSTCRLLLPARRAGGDDAG